MSGRILEDEARQQVLGETIDLTITKPAAGQIKGRVLFLHGAGESTKDRCLPLARTLSSKGWECLTFSFPGHGNSSGSLKGSTLQSRKAVARKLAEDLGFTTADRLVAISMGAHTAISLLKELPGLTNHMALMVPAVYASAAEDAPFGPEFSAVLRQPKSYMTSEIWDILPSYEGKLAIFQTGLDEVIPPVIIDRLVSEAKAARQVDKIVIANSPHRISNWLADDQSRVDDFADAIDRFDFSGLKKYA